MYVLLFRFTNKNLTKYYFKSKCTVYKNEWVVKNFIFGQLILKLIRRKIYIYNRVIRFRFVVE